MPTPTPPVAPPTPAAASSSSVPAAAPEARRSPWPRRLLRTALVAAGLAGAWTAGVGWWLPRWAQPRIEQAGEQALGTPVRLQALHIAPWTLTVTADGLSVGPAAAPHLTVARAQAQLSLQSIWHRAPVLSRISVEQPRLQVERLSADRWSFTPLLAHLQAYLQARQTQAPDSGEPARFALHNIRITGGQAQLVDRVLGQRHEVSGFTLGLPFLSNLPSDIDTDVLPELRLQLDGSLIQAKGRSLPFQAGRRSQLELDWQGIDLPRWASALRPLLPPEQRLDVSRGRLAARLQLQFEQRPAPAAPRLLVAGRLQADDLAARWPAQALDAGWTQLRLEGLSVEPLARRAQVGAIVATGLRGELGWPTAAGAGGMGGASARQEGRPEGALKGAPKGAPKGPPKTAPSGAPPAAPKAAPTAEPASPPAPAAWSWQVARVDLQATRLALRGPAADAQPPRAALPTLGPVRLQAQGLDSRADAPPARLTLDAADSTGAKLQLQASARLAGPGQPNGPGGPGGPSGSGRLQLDGLQPATWLAALQAQGQPALPWHLRRGALSAELTFELQPDRLSLRDGRISATEVDLRLTADAADTVARRSTGRPTGRSPGGPAGRATGPAPRPPAGAPRPASDAGDGLALARLQAEGLALVWRLPAHAQGGGLDALSLTRLDADRLVAQASRDATGRWRGLPVNAPGPTPPGPTPPGQVAPRATATRAKPPATASAPPPRIRIEQLACRGCAVTVLDGTTTPVARLALREATLGAQALSNDPATPISWSVAARDGAGGRLQASGKVRPQPLQLDARIRLDRLDLRPLQPYLEPRLNLTLATGRAVTDGRLRVDALSGAAARAAQARGDAPYAVRWQGRVGLAELRAVDELNDADLLRWKRLDLQGMRAAWTAGELDADLGRVVLDQFYGRVIINASGRLNLADIVRAPETARASLTTPEGAAAADAAAVAANTVAASAAASAPAVPTAPSSAATAGVAAPGSAAVAAEGSAASTSAAAPGPLAASRAPAAAAPSGSTASPPASAAQPPGRHGQTAVAALPPPRQAGPRPQLRWQSVELREGRIDFTDNFIQPNYSARLTRLDGQIAALSSTAPDPAEVRVSGRVDDGAPLEITGRINPLAARVYTDLSGSAQGIELTRLTPYAARYAGYAIEKGTLSVKVHYQVENGQLKAQNQLYLDQLTFGEQVDSPDATKLPVRLAIALLKDRHGVIDINLPVSGSLDDPQFSIGGLIWRVIVNLLTKAVTAPFSLLSGGSDELGMVAFAPGSAELDDAARARLDQLAAKLADRPALRLEATGHADPALDSPGLRERHVLQLMRRAKAESTGQRPGEVSIEPAERERWLTAAYKAADIKKPRNLVGLAKKLSPTEMEALLRADARADEEALRLLANRRGDRVKAYLATKLPAERVLLTASRLDGQGLPADDKGPTTRVQFSVK